MCEKNEDTEMGVDQEVRVLFEKQYSNTRNVFGGEKDHKFGILLGYKSRDCLGSVGDHLSRGLGNLG